MIGFNKTQSVVLKLCMFSLVWKGQFFQIILDAKHIRLQKTCLKQPLKMKTQNWFSRLIIAECR